MTTVRRPTARRRTACRRTSRHRTVRRASRRGAGTPMVLVVAGLVLLAFTVVALTGRVVLVRDRAGVAADQAALAAAAALAELAGTGAPSDSTGVLDRVACSVAGEVAGRNGGRVVACRVTGDLVEFAVAVTVEVDLGFQTPGLPGSVRREAIAGRTRQ